MPVHSASPAAARPASACVRTQRLRYVARAVLEVQRVQHPVAVEPVVPTLRREHRVRAVAHEHAGEVGGQLADDRARRVDLVVDRREDPFEVRAAASRAPGRSAIAVIGPPSVLLAVSLNRLRGLRSRASRGPVTAMVNAAENVSPGRTDRVVAGDERVRRRGHRLDRAERRARRASTPARTGSRRRRSAVRRRSGVASVMTRSWPEREQVVEVAAGERRRSRPAPGRARPVGMPRPSSAGVRPLRQR